jgi:hypothetical protein
VKSKKKGQKRRVKLSEKALVQVVIPDDEIRLAILEEVRERTKAVQLEQTMKSRYMEDRESMAAAREVLSAQNQRMLEAVELVVRRLCEQATSIETIARLMNTGASE